jgi:uncharacterized protein YodC (DUF2158 family)
MEGMNMATSEREILQRIQRLATQEAARREAETVDTGDLLLAMLKCGQGIGYQIVKEYAGLSLREIRDRGDELRGLKSLEITNMASGKPEYLPNDGVKYGSWKRAALTPKQEAGAGLTRGNLDGELGGLREIAAAINGRAEKAKYLPIVLHEDYVAGIFTAGQMGTIVAMSTNADPGDENEEPDTAIEPARFNAGDQVTLKCGGPKMTVVWISVDGDLHCRWTKPSGLVQHGQFDPKVVTPIE